MYIVSIGKCILILFVFSSFELFSGASVIVFTIVYIVLDFGVDIFRDRRRREGRWLGW